MIEKTKQHFTAESAEIAECRMIRAEIIEALQMNIDKNVRITFDDGVVQSVTICSVDDEGFLHSGPDGIEPVGFWTRFEGVTLVEPEVSREHPAGC